jgi:hypothetical protein
MRGDVTEAAAMMVSAHEELPDKRPVSKRVNSSRTPNEDETRINCILDLSPEYTI